MRTVCAEPAIVYLGCEKQPVERVLARDRSAHAREGQCLQRDVGAVIGPSDAHAARCVVLGGAARAATQGSSRQRARDSDAAVVTDLSTRGVNMR